MNVIRFETLPLTHSDCRVTRVEQDSTGEKPGLKYVQTSPVFRFFRFREEKEGHFLTQHNFNSYLASNIWYSSFRQ